MVRKGLFAEAWVPAESHPVHSSWDPHSEPRKRPSCSDLKCYISSDKTLADTRASFLAEKNVWRNLILII